MSLFTKKGATFEIVSENEIILKQGSKVKPLSDSARANLKTLRLIYVDANNVTTNDVIFKNYSSAAAFVLGSNCNGKKYFNVSSKVASTSTKASKASATECENTTSVSATTKAPKTSAKVTTTLDIKSIKHECDRLEKLLSQAPYKTQDDTPLINARVLSEYLHSSTLDQSKNALFNYAYLTGASEMYLEQLKGLLDSAEYADIFSNLQALKASDLKLINNRLVIRVGSGSTGKTTQTEKEYPHALKLVASIDTEPQLLFSYFDLNDKTFKPNALVTAMEKGQEIIIDELGHYSDAVLETLQTILANSNEYYDLTLKRNILIKEGFKIIATTNYRVFSGAFASRAHIEYFKDKTASEMIDWLI